MQHQGGPRAPLPALQNGSVQGPASYPVARHPAASSATPQPIRITACCTSSPALPFVSCPSYDPGCPVCALDILKCDEVTIPASAAVRPQGGWARSPATAAWGGS